MSAPRTRAAYRYVPLLVSASVLLRGLWLEAERGVPRVSAREASRLS